MDENSQNNQGENNSSETIGIENIPSDEGIREENAVEQQKNSKVIGRPFVKGDPRINRKGAPKKVTIWDYLKEGQDEQIIRDFIEDPKFKDKVAEYILGKPKQGIDLTSNGETIFQITPEIANKNGINDNSTRGPEENS